MKLTLQEKFTCMSFVCDSGEEGRNWIALGRLRVKLVQLGGEQQNRNPTNKWRIYLQFVLNKKRPQGTKETSSNSTCQVFLGELTYNNNESCLRQLCLSVRGQNIICFKFEFFKNINNIFLIVFMSCVKNKFLKNKKFIILIFTLEKK